VIRVVLLEPDYWRRRGLTAVLSEAETIEVVDESAGADLVVLSHQHVADRGAGEIACVAARYGCDVLVYGENGDPAVAAEMFRAGARGYCVIDSDGPALLSTAVEQVVAGRIWGPHEALALLAQQNAGEAPLEEEHRRVLELLNEGLSNKEIGQRLGFAEATIKSRLNRLYKRFGVSTRLQLLTTALKRGVVDVRRGE
jgi:two-component system response regulator DevR